MTPLDPNLHVEIMKSVAELLERMNEQHIDREIGISPPVKRIGPTVLIPKGVEINDE